ncbi:MAG: response regulator [Defluviitaleaceae bacterium]|nr:response regulator [Defluviitaleaceae bacterium]
MAVLIVDDVAYMRIVIKDILVKTCGYDKGSILEASGGKEAIAKYKQEKPEIVLCDILMPEVSGIDVVKELIALDPDVKIIMCTSSSEMENVTECINNGAKDYILKPPNPERVKQAVEKIKSKNDTVLNPSDDAVQANPSQHSVLQKEMDALRKDVDFLLKEVAALKALKDHTE